MEFGLSEDQQALQKSAKEFLESEAPVSLARRMLEDPSGFDAGLWKQMAELGWMGLTIPEKDGGLGLGMMELALLLEQMGRLVVPSPLYSTVALAVPVVAALAADTPFRAELYAAIASGERRLTLALAEERATFDAAGVEASAEKSGDGYVLRGAKAFVPDAHVADEIVTVVRLGDKIAVFLVPADECEISPQESLDKTRRLNKVVIDGVRVGQERLLSTPDADAWPAVERALDHAAVALAAEATGVADAVMRASVDYVKERQQFGRAIGTFQAVSHACADMLVATESARSTTYYAAWAIDEGIPQAPLAAATAKAAAGSAAVKVAEDGIQVHGGIGFTWEHDLHLYLRRAKFTELFLGSAAFWRERIASFLASDA